MAFNSTPQDIIEQNINGLLDIHRSWKRVPLALVSDVKNGFAFKSTLFNNQGEGERLIRIRDVLPGDTKTYYSGMVPDGYWVNPDDIVVGMDGDFNLACWQSRPALLNQRVCRLDVTSQSYIKRFFYRVLPGYIEAVNLNTSSTTVKHLSSKTLSELLIPLPPLAEQKVIADKLDTLLAQVENTKARLERIPQILKRFRQSVLAAAVSGRLTEEWRGTQGTSLDSWQQTTFQKICREITVGFVGRMANRYEESGVPFLRSQNVRAFRYSDKNLLYISPAFHQEIYKSRLEPGDLAIVRSGAPGTTCVIPKSLGAANCSDLVIARPSPHLLPEFGCIFMNSEVARKNVSDNQVGVAQQHFNVGSMKKMPIHLPPVDEQTEIVRRVDQLFAHADRIEQQVNNALARVNNLTQSILAKAFRGELTEQWRKDNPELISGENSAEALLERIKAERAAAKPPKKTRKRKTMV